MKTIAFFLLGLTLDSFSAIHAPDSGFAGALTLEKALSLVFQNHPGLEASQKAVLAREAARVQSAKGQNPELAFEVEDMAGTGAHRGLERAQATVQISQPLEWGGKRQSRKDVTAADKNMAELELTLKRMEIDALTRSHFMEALAAQKRKALSEEAQALAERVLNAVSRRVKEGAASTADEFRARQAVSEAEMHVRQETIRLEAAKRRLSLLWGGEETPVPPLQGDLESLRPLPLLEKIISEAQQSPLTALKSESIRLAQARLAYQSNLSKPDITLSAGYRYIADAGDMAFLAGVALPLPIRNRNQGGWKEAEQEVAQAEAEGRAALVELKSLLTEIHADLSVIQDEITTLKDRLIPDAEQASRILEEGYRHGRFGMLDVLNAGNDLFRNRTRYWEAVLNFQRGQAELESLMGRKEN